MAAETATGEQQARALEKARRAHAAFKRDSSRNPPISAQEAELLREAGEWDFAGGGETPVRPLVVEPEGGQGEETTTAEPEPQAVAAAAPKAGRRQYREVSGDWLPRWLPASGVSRVIGPTNWSTWQGLVMFDHATMGLTTYRREVAGLPEKAAFAIPTAEIVNRTGLSDRSIRRAVVELLDVGLLDHYKPGFTCRGRYDWPQFHVSTDKLIDLYLEAGRCLPRRLGGFQGVLRDQVPDEGLRIYGYRGQPGEVVVSWRALDRRAREDSGRIDLGRIAQLLGREWIEPSEGEA